MSSNAQAAGSSSLEWHKYPVQVYPHHTDYAGVVWHGTYLTWLEAARIERLQALGLGYHEMVNLGYELPVVEINIRYHTAVTMGDRVIVNTRLEARTGVRIILAYRIESADGSRLHVSGNLTLVAIDRASNKIARTLPEAIEKAISSF